MAISKSDRYFLQRSEVMQQKSHDPHRQVGVIIVDANGNIIGSGTNAPPAELGLTLAESLTAIEEDPAWKYFILEHAERNAINSARNSGKELKGTTMYGTLFPCADCARAIVAGGISRLVVPGPGGDPHRDQKWRDHYRFAHRIFELAEIQVDIIPIQNGATVDDD